MKTKSEGRPGGVCSRGNYWGRGLMAGCIVLSISAFAQPDVAAVTSRGLPSWSAVIDAEGEKAQQLDRAQQEFESRRREMKKRHYGEMIALERSKLADVENLLSEEEMLAIRSLWGKELRAEHAGHEDHTGHQGDAGHAGGAGHESHAGHGSGHDKATQSLDASGPQCDHSGEADCPHCAAMQASNQKKIAQ